MRAAESAAGGVIEAVKQKPQAKESQDDDDDRRPISGACGQPLQHWAMREHIKREQCNREKRRREIGRTQMMMPEMHGISPRNSLE